ncbi:MAG: type II toxin-antitoxin system VapC family toxin [Nitrolancea sp.]
MSYLIDTDLIIDGLHAVASALALLEDLAPSGLAVSILSLGELYEGAYHTPDPESHRQGVDLFLHGYRLVGLDQSTMVRFARERAELRRQGLMIPDFDLLIAATALTHQLTLVTRNTRHFQRIPDLQIHQ